MIHPTKEALQAFLNGHLIGAEQQSIEDHVSDCTNCCDLLREIPPDSLVQEVRAAGTWLSQDETLSAEKLPPRSFDAAEFPAELSTHARYRVLRRLGAGGMGVVYQAEHRLMERMVALKVINQRLVDSTHAVDRFRQEVKAAAKLSHRNIVTAFDAEQAGDLHFLVMEFIDGLDLAQDVRHRGPLPVMHACNYVMQAALGLQHAAGLGMVHRDIKPQNLMRSKKGAIKILDFGLACLATGGEAARLTKAGVALGTADYVAPEQIEDSRQVDGRADIYSLGCTLYYLLAGCPPFAGGSAVDKIIAHLNHLPESLTQRRPETPAKIVALVERMMSKAPEDRPQSAREVVTALKPFGRPAANLADAAVDPVFELPSGGRQEHRVAKRGSQPAGNVIPSPHLPRHARPAITRRLVLWIVGCTAACLLCVAFVLGWPDPATDQQAGRALEETADSSAATLPGLNVDSRPVVATELAADAASPPFDPPTSTTDEWTEFAPSLEPENVAAKGQWYVSGGELHAAAAVATWLSLPMIPPAEYDYEVQFTRLTGIHSVALFFVVGTEVAAFDIDAWELHLVGIQEVGGVSLRDHGAQFVEQRLVNGNRYTALVKVRSGLVTCYLDGQQMASYEGDGFDLSLPAIWEMPNSKRLGIGVWNSRAIFHRVRVRSASE